MFADLENNKNNKTQIRLVICVLSNISSLTRPLGIYIGGGEEGGLSNEQEKLLQQAQLLLVVISLGSVYFLI